MCCNFQDAAKQKQCIDRFDFCGGPDQSWGEAAMNCQQYMKCPASLIVYKNTVLNKEKRWKIEENKDETAANCKFQILANPDIEGKIKVNLKSSENAMVDVISFPDPSIYGEEYGFKGKYKNGRYDIGLSTGEFEAPSDWVIFVNYKFTDGPSFIEVITQVENYAIDDFDKHGPKSDAIWEPSKTYEAFRVKEAENASTREQRERIEKIKEQFLKSQEEKEEEEKRKKEEEEKAKILTPAE